MAEKIGAVVTSKLAYGGFSHEKFKEITCVINRLEETKLKEIINDIDKTAFVTVYDVAEVKGSNFRNLNHH